MNKKHYNKNVINNNISLNNKSDAEPDVEPDVEPDAESDAEPDVEPDAESEAEHDAEPNNKTTKYSLNDKLSSKWLSNDNIEITNNICKINTKYKNNMKNTNLLCDKFTYVDWTNNYNVKENINVLKKINYKNKLQKIDF